MIPVVLGTRGSPLAQAQARLMREALKRACPTRTFEIHIVKTKGDQLTENPPAKGEKLDKGLFTAELERALLEKKIHVAVHSLKDLPTDEVDGLVIAATPQRADPRDVLITREALSLDQLPYQARIATGSPRRTAQLKLARPDIQVVDIRGNIDTRLKKFREMWEWSGLILAAAGLERLKPDISDLAVTPLPLEVMLPAPGQGALALQTRRDATDIMQLLAKVHDPMTHAAVSAERMFLRALGGGCEEPIAAYAWEAEKDHLKLEGVAWLFDEKLPRRGRMIGESSDPIRLGTELAVHISR
jgi:hydroxymethylbilane synthase